MKITFLGTGGGRFTTISQKRMTGGFRIDSFNGKNFHIDPGPGALVRSYQFGLNPASLDGIFVSHSHTDHYNDAEVLIEAMTRGMTKTKGIVMGSQSVFNGYKQWGPAISKYHTGQSEKLVLGPNKTKNFENFTIKGTKTVHGDPTAVGFQLKSNDLVISYTSDTKYFENLYKYHKGSDILIASVIRPGNQTIKGHMCTRNFINLVNEVKPKLAIMTHFGFKMLSENPNDEAKRVFNETGIATLAAFDGMVVSINPNNVSNFKVDAIDKNIEYHESNLNSGNKESKYNKKSKNNKINNKSNTFKSYNNPNKNTKTNTKTNTNTNTNTNNNPNINNTHNENNNRDNKSNKDNKDNNNDDNDKENKKNKKNKKAFVSKDKQTSLNSISKNTFTKDFSYSKKG
jgi:phosphoribosyl 1,2-cyclic phosphodiesterase